VLEPVCDRQPACGGVGGVQQPSTVSSSRAHGSNPAGVLSATLSSADPVMPTTASP
jgi:hypothetical protein